MKIFAQYKIGTAYYLFLLLILVTWTNSESLPPMPLRITFMCAVILPLWIKKSFLLPEIFFTYVVISASSFAVSYMPVDGFYVLITIILSIIILGKRKGIHLKIPITFKMLCLLAIFMDSFFSSDKLLALNWLVIIIVAETFFFVEDYRQLRVLAFSFAVISLVLSLEFIFMGNYFITDVNTLYGSIDRKGWTDPNYFGSILGFGIFTSIVELITNNFTSKKIRIFYFITILVSLYTLFGTASRGAVIALTCSSLILLFIYPLRNPFRFGIIAMGIFVLFIMYKLHMLDLLILRFLSDEGDAGGRSEIWIPRINAFLNDCNPIQWMFGLGTDAAMRLGTSKYIGFHNDYLAVLVKYGFVGFSCLLGLLLKPVLSSIINKGIVAAGIVYISLCMFSIEPFTGGQWGCLYFYLYIILLSQVKYEKSI